MPKVLAPTPKVQFTDATGAPLVSGKLYTYEAGTTTPLATYTDSTGSTPNANPVILDSRGEASVWLSDASYKFVLKTSADVTVWTVDAIAGGNVAGYATTAAVAAGYQPLDTQLTSLAALSYTGNASKIVRINAGESGFEAVAPGTLTFANYVTESIIIPVTGQDVTLTTGTAKFTFWMPYAFTVTAVRAHLVTAQTSGSIVTVDINEAGTTILSTKLTIDNTEQSSTTAATPAVISDAALADNAKMTIDVDQVGDGTAKGLVVTLIGHQ